jgi:hypothetical protein
MIEDERAGRAMIAAGAAQVAAHATVEQPPDCRAGAGAGAGARASGPCGARKARGRRARKHNEWRKALARLDFGIGLRFPCTWFAIGLHQNEGRPFSCKPIGPSCRIR